MFLLLQKNYNLITLYRLYEHIFRYNQFEKDNDMANLYVKYKIADFRGEDTTNIQEEINTAYQKIYNKYNDLNIFKKIEEHYKYFTGLSSM
jgi:hypothetical protein